MARPDELPGFREKRDILFGDKTSDEKRRETGRMFMEAEQYDDALEFFARCDADDLVREIARRASQQANTALLLRAMVVLGEKADQEQLVSMAHRAEEAGRKSMARLAYEKAGQEEEAERLKRELLGGEEPQDKPDALAEEQSDTAS